MTTPLELTNRQARHLFLHRQGLTGNPRARQSKEDLLDLIRQMGFVQIDSIRTVERAHHMILFSRNHTYQQEHLRELLEEDRHLFEHWTHDASIIPTQFFPIWRHRFRKAEEKLREGWIKRGRGAFEDELDAVLSHIETHGPTLSRDLLKDEHRRKGASPGWWDWHPRKSALEYLWRTGILSVDSRAGFQKVYDLSQRVIPEDHHAPELSPDKEAFIDWCCREALQRLGVATAGELAAFWGLITAAQAKKWVEQHKENLLPVLVQNADGSPSRPAYAFPELEDELSSLSGIPGFVRVLSPFDPVLRDRKRLSRLFNFDYRIEIFVPEAKRVYGYYVFPLLEGDRMIGRVDAKVETDKSKSATLVVRKIWLEDGVTMTDTRKKSIDRALDRIRKFAGASDMRWL